MRDRNIEISDLRMTVAVLRVNGVEKDVVKYIIICNSQNIIAGNKWGWC